MDVSQLPAAVVTGPNHRERRSKLGKPQDRKIHIGRVESEYQYDPSLDLGYPNLRKVKWLAGGKCRGTTIALVPGRSPPAPDVQADGGFLKGTRRVPRSWRAPHAAWLATW